MEIIQVEKKKIKKLPQKNRMNGRRKFEKITDVMNVTFVCVSVYKCPPNTIRKLSSAVRNRLHAT